MILGSGIILGVALGLLTGPIAGGSPRLRIRGEMPLVGALLVTLLLPFLTALGADGRVIYLSWISLMMTLLVLCTMNLPTRGFPLLAAGAALNLLVILLNGAMPVSATAVSVISGTHAGAVLPTSDAFHAVQGATTRFAVLADVLPLSGPPGWRAVFSVGDMLMLVGVAVVIASHSQRLRSPWRRTSRPGAESDASGNKD